MGKAYEAHTNAIGKEASRLIQLDVLRAISEIVMQTAGPKGSTAMITSKDGTYPIYSKDGKKVAEHIDIFGEVERGILDQIIQITDKVVKEVGDGTSSAIRLAYFIFKGLVEYEKNHKGELNSYDIIEGFQKAADRIIERIKKAGREATVSDMYDICMISTNGNEKLSDLIFGIYTDYGLDVHIDLKTSTNDDFMLKEYDGLTLNRGMTTPAFVNSAGEKCVLRNPKIYVFKDPIDTPEMIGFFTRIVYDNILTPYNNLKTIAALQKDMRRAAGMSEKDMDELEKNSKMEPTVIMAPFVSRDVQALLTNLEQLLYAYDRDDATRATKPPICIVTNLVKEADELSDISMLCGCKSIFRYIDETVQQKDIESGVAPTVDTVVQFCGSAEEVIIDKEKTKFINPSRMYEDTEDAVHEKKYSTTYTGLVSFLKKQLAHAKETGEDLVETNRLKRRLNGLTSALVELYVGGISVTDRESTKDLADDAIRNCRSAALKGVGRACNYEGFMASFDDEEHHTDYNNIINKAYGDLIFDLYKTAMPFDRACKEYGASLQKYEKPINLRTLEYTNDVLTSIDTDIVILEAISKIVTIMFTSNQILTSSAIVNNSYAGIDHIEGQEDEEDDEEE